MGARLAARSTRRSARREWNRRGERGVRFARLRSALSILERRQDGHHVVAFDPTEREAAGPARRAQRRSPRGREEPPSPRGRRVMRESDDDLDEIVRTSRRRAVKTEEMSEAEGDKIQIEVGSVKAFEAKHSVYRGAFWTTLLSLMLWWIPVLGPAVAGYVGGRKAGSPLRGAIAAAIPVAIAFGALAAIASSTGGVPAALRQAAQAGYTGVLGSLPFDFPILGYVLSNLAAIMNSGPDALFSVLAFALVGGAVTQMKVQEHALPPITARLPASRVGAPMVQAPARALSRAQQAEVDDLVARMNSVLARAERAGGVPATAAAQRSRWFGLSRRRAALRYPEQGPLAARPAAAELDAASRQVVAQMLATTPGARGARGARGVRAQAPVDFEMPQTIAFASPAHATGAEGRTSAHSYRPSKLYHIYGGSVNPVARAKLEKRLRRTHTLHVMRGRARAFGEMVEVDSAGEPTAAHAPQDEEKPRSLEAAALGSGMHYDALEHLENARFEAPRKHAAPARAEEDDLGGVMAHIGEGGEAVVDERAVEDIDFERGPVFDRRGRQRARIAGEETPEGKAAGKAPAAQKAHATAPAAVREAIEVVEARTGRAILDDAVPSKSKVARSADRVELTDAQKEKVDRWLKRTLAAEDIERANAHGKGKPAVNPGSNPGSNPAAAPAAIAPDMPAKPKALPSPERRDSEAHPLPEEAKPAHKRAKGDAPAPAFDVTHGSTEVDAEAASAENDAVTSKKNRTAADILREIRLQKKADKEAEAGEEVARAAKRAKQAADEIERLATQAGQGAPLEMVALKGEETPTHAERRVAAKKRQQSGDLEAVETDSEKLSGDLELTLSPIREEGVTISEVGDSPAPSVHASPARDERPIAMVGNAAPQVTLSEAVEAVGGGANSPPPAAAAGAAERDVKPGEVVLAGPSTDVALGDSGEADLTARDEDRIRKRLQEGWNRL